MRQMKKPLKYRDLRKRLRNYGVEEDKARGKGSERIFYGVVDGKPVAYPTNATVRGMRNRSP